MRAICRRLSQAGTFGWTPLLLAEMQAEMEKPSFWFCWALLLKNGYVESTTGYRISDYKLTQLGQEYMGR